MPGLLTQPTHSTLTEYSLPSSRYEGFNHQKNGDGNATDKKKKHAHFYGRDLTYDFDYHLDAPESEEDGEDAEVGAAAG